MRFLVKRNGFLLTGILIIACVMFVCAGKSVKASDAKTTIFNSAYLNDPNHVLSRATEQDLSTSFRRMIAAVLIFALLGAAAIYASKKILPKYSHTGGKKIKIVEAVRLDARKTIYLVEVANQQILLGATQDRITKLADIFGEKEFPQIQADDNEGSK